MLKSELRKEIRRRKQQFSAQQLHDMSAEIIARLLNHERIREAKTVLMYYSLPDEVDTREAINLMADSRKRILLPRVVDKENMVICSYRGINDLKSGSLNVLEPCGEPFEALEEIDVAVVPGMSFDPDCHRMGRGKGYYDRFLAKIPQAYKIGICFDFQKLRHVPTDEYDVLMDEVL